MYANMYEVQVKLTNGSICCFFLFHRKDDYKLMDFN